MLRRIRGKPIPHGRDGGKPFLTFTKIAALVGLMVLGSVAVFCQCERIEGKVRTSDGRPLPQDITARLEEAEGVAHQFQLVGTDGKFSFGDIRQDLIYRLVVTAKGFQTATWEVDTHFLASCFPTILLVPSGEKKSALPSAFAPTPTDLAAPKKAKKEFEKGSKALHEGNLSEARGHLEKAVALDPCYARAQTALGVAFILQNELIPAESAFRKSIKCDGVFLEAYIQLAILLNAKGKYAATEEALQDGLRRSPDDWHLHYQLGIAHIGMGKYEKAKEDLLKVQSVNSAPPAELHFRLADVYLNRKEYEKAYAQMQAYLQADPSGDFAAQTRVMMHRLESSGVLAKFPPVTN
jgi:predicted Zn-dependent protease